ERLRRRVRARLRGAVPQPALRRDAARGASHGLRPAQRLWHSSFARSAGAVGRSGAGRRRPSGNAPEAAHRPFGASPRPARSKRPGVSVVPLMDAKRLFRGPVAWVALAIALLLVMLTLVGGSGGFATRDISAVQAQIIDGNVAKATLNDRGQWLE